MPRDEGIYVVDSPNRMSLRGAAGYAAIGALVVAGAFVGLNDHPDANTITNIGMGITFGVPGGAGVYVMRHVPGLYK